MNPNTAKVTKLVPADSNRSIGVIMVESARITLAEAEQILRLQKEHGIRFGEAAIQLGLLTTEDIQFALAHQYRYPCLRRGQSRISQEMVAAYEPRSAQVEALRALRSHLMLRWFASDSGNNKMLAVVGPGHGEGRSYLAANLAIVFSQLGETTLLIDADMRQGRQHQLFHVENYTGLSTVLAGRSPTVPVLRLAELEALSILTAGPVPPNPQELLGRDVFQKLLEKFSQMFDVIIIDTPAGTAFADAQTIAARAGGALMVVRQNETSIEGASRYAKNLTELGVSVVGAVLNDF
jgi:receptor protein-tyrosine kinase